MIYRENADDREAALKPYLQRDEQLDWSAHARTGLIFHRSDLLNVPFVLAAAAFVLCWTRAVVSQGRGPMPFFGEVCAAVGIYLVVGRFVVDAWRRRRTVYGLSDKRVLVLMGRKLTSVPLWMLGAMSLTERRNGGGTITLTPDPDSEQVAASLWPARRSRFPSLELARDARGVYVAIREARDRGGPQGS